MTLPILVAPVVAFLMPSRVVWPYITGTVLLIIGLGKIIRDKPFQARGLDNAVIFGPLFLAVPMGVFGTDHFIAPRFIATLVPSWIPGHLFWVYFVGTALIAAALSIIANNYSALAATLLSAMLFSFVLLIHIPALAANPHNRFLLAVPLRDLSLSSGALAYALPRAETWPARLRSRLTILVRYMLGVPTVVFGVEHFLHPQYVPVVPLKQLMPSWIPGHLPLAYVIGAILIGSGLCLIFNWKARLLAAWLGIIVFIVVLLVYLPILIANLSNIADGLNYFADTLAFSGAALLLAGALPNQPNPAA